MSLIIRRFSQCDYLAVYQAMVDFNKTRGKSTADEIWFLQHQPVYTLGQAAKTEHLLAPGNIPVIRTDRGGQVTYHGPGQMLCYLLIDLGLRKLSIKGLVQRIEQSIIDMLAELGLKGERKLKAPGVYIDGKKIAALGLRVRNNCSYHGFSLNVDLDLSPYKGINPCGYAGLPVTRLSDYGISNSVDEIADKVLPFLSGQLQYDKEEIETPGEPGTFPEYKELA